MVISYRRGVEGHDRLSDVDLVRSSSHISGQLWKPTQRRGGVFCPLATSGSLLCVVCDKQKDDPAQGSSLLNRWNRPFVFTSAAAKESKQSVRKRYNNRYSKHRTTSQKRPPPSSCPADPQPWCSNSFFFFASCRKREESEWVPPPNSLLRQLHPLTFTPVECVFVLCECMDRW